jgi:hypothetical protein
LFPEDQLSQTGYLERKRKKGREEIVHKYRRKCERE